VKYYTEEEDKIIKKYAGVKKTEDIALILGRSASSLEGRVKKLGVSLRMKGENHHGSKLSNLQIEMIYALKISGFRACEIHKAAFNHVNYNTVHLYSSTI